jgi:hypothetical protein
MGGFFGLIVRIFSLTGSLKPQAVNYNIQAESFNLFNISNKNPKSKRNQLEASSY